jgi:hypothetical protein
MSSVPQVSPSVASNRHPVRSGTKYPGALPGPFPVPKSRILMVGQNTSWGAPLQSTLKKLGCDFTFAPSLRVTTEQVRRGSYALLLLDSTVPPALRRQLVSGLVGSEASIYQLFPVENGCWWLPVLLSGEDCFGSPGFRTKELPAELARVLRDRP